jgi:adenylate cyclase
MATEIERKYLVGVDRWRGDAGPGEVIRLGYLSTDPDRTVRVRLRDQDTALLTVKGRNVGPTRPEYEYEIPRADGEELLKLCIEPIVEKRRYLLERGPFTWEIDVFAGANEGLVLAEVELDDEDTEPDIPDWVAEEVTGDPRFYNVNLVENPYTSWE